MAIRILKFLAKAVIGAIVALVLVIVVTVFSLTVAFFFTKEIHLPTETARSLIDGFVPASVKIEFNDFDLRLERIDENFWAKRLVIDSKKLCVQYEKTAVDTCIDEFYIAASFGWGGDLPPEQNKFIPHIIEIEPIGIIGGDIAVDLTAFPESNEPKKEGGFDFLSFLRKEILPKWDIEGSRVEIRNFKIRLSPESTYTAKFDLQRGDGDNTVEAILHEVRAVESELLIHADIAIKRPASWGGDASDADVTGNVWKVLANGDVNLEGGKQIRLKADANITGFNELDFRIQTFFKGLPVVREVRLEGALDQAVFAGKISAQVGSNGTELRGLDFVNCLINANLDEKVGGVRCGPQSVRMQIREFGAMKRPDLYVFAPEFELKVTKLSFDETKSAEYSFGLVLDHLGLARVAVQLAGAVESGEQGFKYSVKGRADAIVPEFLEITGLLRRTPYSIPAPLNTLDGAVSLRADIDFNQDGGGITYAASTRLDSTYQAMHLDLDGKTNLVKAGDGLVPETDATLSIVRLNISAPRFDLRAPPAFKPDGRFGKIEKEKFLKKPVVEVAKPSGKFKLRVRTASPEVIRIATNLTKASVPLSVDVVYDTGVKAPSPVSGYVLVGRTPVELFKRNANIETLRVDLLPTGDNRLNGRVSIRYLDYAINVLLLGQAADPQIRFESDPPLDDDQIIAVLLFGKPPGETLADDDQSTVGNTKAAIADAVLGFSSLYLLASTPVESVGYDPDSGRVTARVGLGGGASIELGAGSAQSGQGVGFRKRISREFIFRSDVETIGTTGERTVSALIEWVKRF